MNHQIKKYKLFIYNSISALIILFTSTVKGQDLEPRAYANLPKGTNVLALGYGYNKGNVLSDPSLPIKDFKINTQIFAINYIHSFSLANKLARVQVSVPMADMQGKLILNGEQVTGSRTGFADMRIRFGVNLTGSPALDRKNFLQYQQKAIFGVSLVTSVPIGKYYPDKKINLGANRWGFKPEIGISKRFKHVYAEAYVGTWFYTNNNDYFNGNELKQKPTISFQAHASYYFKNQMWVGFNTNWYKVGEVSINGVDTDETQKDWRVGATFSVPITKTQALRLQYHTGIYADLGLNYDSLTLAYQYVFF
ncbi:transporter [Flavobacterium nackdongense]|uniref:Transporter n=1 Tax=Flavobacterium nackdongense TaxID=2547394 RepID=A0A4P6YBI7_9FLAO|nr:transporter [Flavobacterium nackdongense]QBN17690.1 transporter [Flavobacterium nackdongense]